MSLVDRHSSPATWMSAATPLSFSTPVANGVQGPPRYVHPAAYPPTTDVGLAPIPQKNEQELTREALFHVLEHFSQLVAQHFAGRPIRLVVHGGACMLLHQGLYRLSVRQHEMSPSLPRRTTTRDVDYIHRSFVTEMAAAGMPDAAARLAECIKGTARKFGLGLDWMNSDADIALPYAFDPSGKPYDPIYTASVQQNNIDLHTVYTAPNKFLTLISVTPFWAVSLKLSRYVKWDPGDICLLLMNGVVLSGTHWTPEQLESWLYTQCWAMGYAHFDAIKKQQLKERILHAINQLKIWNEAVGISDDCDQGHRKRERDKEKEDRDRAAFVLPPPMGWGGRTLSAHDAMGGGEVVSSGGYSPLSSGWTPATGQWPSRDQALRSPPPPSWNVVDWADGKLSTPGGAGSSSDKEKKADRDAPRSRPASKSRAPSRAASGHEVFIPDSGDEGDGPHMNGVYRGRSPRPGAGQQSVRDPQWIYLNPNHAPNTKHPSSRQRSPDPYGIYALPKGKGLDGLGSTLGRSLNTFEYGAPPHDSRSIHQRLQSQMGSTLYHDYHDPDSERKAALRNAQAEKMRKKKEKERRRTKEIGKARSSKWARQWQGKPTGSSSDTGSSEEESDESTEEDEGIADNRRAMGSRDGKTSSTGSKNGRRRHDHLHDVNGWHAHNSYSVPHAATPAAASSLHLPSHFQQSGSRPGSRNASPSLKKRPPPLALSPPPVIPSAMQHDTVPANPGRSRHPNDTNPTAHLGVAAERAQYQFEQQQLDYQRQLAKQIHQPTVKEVAQRVAEQIAAQQAAAHFHAHSQASHHGQMLRGNASWAQPHQPVVVGTHHQQSWYHQPQQPQHHHQPQRSNQRLRMTEIYP